MWERNGEMWGPEHLYLPMRYESTWSESARSKKVQGERRVYYHRTINNKQGEKSNICLFL